MRWEENEETAIRIGLDLERYWTESPKQFEKHVKIWVEMQKDRAKELDYNNFNLGKYIAYAVNNPKKYPRKPFSDTEEKELRPMTSKEMERMMRKNTILLGGKVR